MDPLQRKALRRLTVLTLVLSGHVLLVMLFSSSRQSDTRKGVTRTEPYTPLMLLDLESRVEQPPPEQPPTTPPSASVTRPRADRPRKSTPTTPSEPTGAPSDSTAITVPTESGVVPKIDWQREMEITVETVAPKMIKAHQQRCAEAERNHAPRPPGCNRRSYDGAWRPSGNMAQDMRDPDRPRSSVPEPLPDAFPKAPRPEAIQQEE